MRALRARDGRLTESMDVKCERCNTEYEFDDALVSGRGTTVRCTECGHQFKVRRSGAADVDGRHDAEFTEQWVVQISSGQQLTFLTLGELQRAILAKRVTRRDLLLLSGGTSRPLGSIAELEPLFEGRTSTYPSHAGHVPAGGVVAAPVVMADPRPQPDMTRTAPWGLGPPAAHSAEPVLPPAPDTLRPPAGSSGVAPPPAAVRPFVPAPVDSPREASARERRAQQVEDHALSDRLAAGRDGFRRPAWEPEAPGVEEVPPQMRAAFD
ncbi:MAG: zinc-ribbon domain-containing protein, partial [Myxococcota bacterium]|nr:zinc-ribbon domain-containing protein [Myxococcota bacterium]